MKVPRKLYFTVMSTTLTIGLFLIMFDIQLLGWSLLVLSVIFFIIATQKEKVTVKDMKINFTKAINDYIRKHEIEINKSYFSQSNKTNISFSHDEGILYLFNSLPSFNAKLIDYKDIVESHLIENGDTITKTSRTSQIGGMLVGGALLGAGGAIIGGLSGKKNSSTVIKSLELKIIVDDLNNPVITIPLKDVDDELTKNSPIFKELYDKGYEIHKIISLIIKQEEEKQNSAI